MLIRVFIGVERSATMGRWVNISSIMIREMKIYTKTGDKGKSSLYSGERVSKASSRFETLGCVDELSSWIGLCREQISASKLLKQDAIVQV